MATINLGRVGFVNHGTYDNGITYKTNSIVKYNGSLYASKTITLGNLPTNASYWEPWIDLSVVCDLTTNQTIAGTKTFTSQPIGIVKASIGLPNVDNTSDANKPVSTAQATALALKVTNFNYVTKTSAYTALSNDYIYADTTTAFTITLPASPALNDCIGFLDIKSLFDTKNLTINRNGKNIMGLAEDLTVSTKNIEFELIYADGNWRLK